MTSVLSLTEEQKRQHEESMKQVQTKPKYLFHVNRGEIPLIWKQHPTIEDPYYNALLNFYEVQQKELEEGEEKKSEQDGQTKHSSSDSRSMMEPPKELEALKVQDPKYYQSESCISSRGMVDVSLLKELLREGYNEFVPPPTPTVSSSSDKKVPVLKFPTKVKSVTNLWDIANARKYNVHVIRPSHDAWGIKKVALVFCDDFLQRVYDLPWWHGMKYNDNDVHKEISKKLQQAMEPIFDVLGIQSTQVVRLLFAALPPGVTIPVHHDTGEWVKQTHRVHVPIFVPNNNDASCILFQCGPLTNQMNRVECSEGHVFEMNNQAKHMVSNCHSTEYRVHCILDYVSKDHPVVTSQQQQRRIQLNPGERIYQTRRSIDRECDQGKRSTPSFLILGAQKCGTTSLYNYITQHPLCVPTKKRETHGFDWRWPQHLVQTSSSKKKGDTKQDNGTTNDDTQQGQEERLLTKEQIRKIRTYLNEQSYFCKELERYPSCLTGDSTPSYLVHPDLVIPRLKQIYPHLNKFCMIVRNPTKRCYSHYQMVTDPNGTETQKRTRGSEWQHKTFEQVVMEDFQRMSDIGLIPYWNISTHEFDQDVFDQFVGSDKEQEAYQSYQRLYIPQNTGSHTPVLRGMYHLQLRTWLSEFSSIDQFHIIALERMTQDVHKTMKGVYEFLELPQLSSIEDTSPKNTRTYRDPIPSSMETMLNKFYRPQNEYFIRFVTSFNNSEGSSKNNNNTKEWMTEEYWKDLWKCRNNCE